jgi:hypothetical protein
MRSQVDLSVKGNEQFDSLGRRETLRSIGHGTAFGCTLHRR